MNRPPIKLCRECSASIVFLKTAARKSIPVDAATVEDHDTEFDHRRHVSHFATCSKPERFRK